MANVLPQQDRAALRRGYWLRLLATFTFIYAASVCIGIVSLIPAYLSAQVEMREVQEYREIQNQTREMAKNDTAVQAARLVNTQVEQLLVSNLSATHAINYILRDWEAHAEDIIISSMNFTPDPGGKQAMPELRISGQARNRSALNEFVQTLRADSTFTDVSFPISDLISEGIVDFSLSVRFKP